MTQVTVHEYAAALRPRYRAARRKEKGRILDEFCTTTKLHRKAAIRLLCQETQPRASPRGRRRKYGSDLLAPLRQVWEIGDRMSGKLLVAVMPNLVQALERHGELQVSAEVREKLLAMSASTCDRLLKKSRPRIVSTLSPRHKEPAPASLKRQVPLRTFSEWKEVKAGWLQADLVLHSGESLEGFHLSTLTAIDVATSWTELQPVWGTGKTRVGTAMHLIRERLPFPLRGLHTDNGGEFINLLLVPWCQREKIIFTRGRAYKKNDQAWVEQRNWQSVRRHVGYLRYSSKAAFDILGQLYPLLCLQANFFRPVRKLIAKEREGARVHKHYDEPRTPYQRLTAAGVLSAESRARIEKRLGELNPAELQRRIDQLLERLFALAGRAGVLKERGSLVSVG